MKALMILIALFSFLNAEKLPKSTIEHLDRVALTLKVSSLCENIFYDNPLYELDIFKNILKRFELGYRYTYLSLYDIRRYCNEASNIK